MAGARGIRLQPFSMKASEKVAHLSAQGAIGVSLKGLGAPTSCQ
jgi:hypothetical protein